MEKARRRPVSVLPTPVSTTVTAKHAMWAGAGVYVALYLILLPRSSYDIVGGMALTPLVILLGTQLVRRFASREEDPYLRRIFVLGYALKLLASAAFFLLVFAWLGGDASSYHADGADVAAEVWRGQLTDVLASARVGTRTMELLAGGLYVVIGPTAAAGFAVFATLSYIGSYLLFRAFVLAVPGGNHRLYAALCFLMPSMLFWPSSLGKEAWMILGLGLTSFGAAKILVGQRGTLALLAGVGATGVLRPHMAALTLTALAAAPLAQRVRQLSKRARRGRALLLVLVLVVGAVATIAAQRTFGLASVSPSEIRGFLEALGELTAIGGSAFENVQATNPLLAPVALVSVLFRPFPHEVASPIMAVAAAESLFLIWLILRHRGSFGRTLAATRRNSFVAYALIYTLLFGLGYSFFNNLGLLVRERVQVLPFLFVLVAGSATAARQHGSSDELVPR